MSPKALTTTIPPPQISVGPNGRVQGADGMMDQVGEALMRHAGPMLVNHVLPAVRADTQMQDRIGAAAGKAAAEHLLPWIALGTLTAVGVILLTRRSKPARHSHARRR